MIDRIVVPVYTFRELEAHLQLVNHKEASLSILLGDPGTGKTTTAQKTIKGAEYFDGHLGGFEFFLKLCPVSHKPIILDDLERFLNDKQAVPLLRACCDTKQNREVHWDSHSPYLCEPIEGKVGPIRFDTLNKSGEIVKTVWKIPRSYYVSGSFIIIANRLNILSDKLGGVASRANLIEFKPSALEVHKEVEKRGFAEQEVFDYIATLLGSIEHPDMRMYVRASTIHKANLAHPKQHQIDWKAMLYADIQTTKTAKEKREDEDYEILKTLLANTDFLTKEERRNEYCRLTGESPATFYRRLESLNKVEVERAERRRREFAEWNKYRLSELEELEALKKITKEKIKELHALRSENAEIQEALKTKGKADVTATANATPVDTISGEELAKDFAKSIAKEKKTKPKKSKGIEVKHIG